MPNSVVPRRLVDRRLLVRFLLQGKSLVRQRCRTRRNMSDKSPRGLVVGQRRVGGAAFACWATLMLVWRLRRRWLRSHESADIWRRQIAHGTRRARAQLSCQDFAFVRSARPFFFERAPDHSALCITNPCDRRPARVTPIHGREPSCTREAGHVRSTHHHLAAC